MYHISFYNIYFVQFALYTCKLVKWRSLQQSLRAEVIEQTGITGELIKTEKEAVLPDVL